MTSERRQRQIDLLLDEAEAAIRSEDWATVQQRVRSVLALDPENADALAYSQAAERGGVSRTADAQTEPPGTRTPDLAQPTSFASGRYQVKRFLGEGGKKKVYLAHDTLLDRDVAFALIKTEGLDATSRERIAREAQSMGRLGDHPNVVTVFDIGEEAGQPFMVLPLLPGGDIEGLIEKAPEHRLPLDRLLQIGIETCQGLEFAHGKGIVHRDLKPGNVWLTADGRAQIGDFGLAVAIDRSRLTQAGMMVGTVAYMPPEQALGGEIGPRSDLYSFGCMLYEMVCGRPPFVGDESVAIIGQHLNTPPVAPSWHRPDCPPGLEALILRLLEKDVAKRPESAAEVRTALQSVSMSPVAPAPSIEKETAEKETAIADPLYQRTFVGREQELRQLHSAFDAALSGQGLLAMVVGEPGIGKTSACEQLATYVTLRGGKYLIGHCYEEGSLSLPYLPFVEAMRSYVLAREPDELRKELGSGASEVARIVSEVRDKVQVSPSDGGDPEEQRWRLLQAATSFLRNASMVQPLLLVLEDLHDADRGTLDLLLHLSRNLEGARLLIVGTYRDVEVDRAHPLSAAVAELRRAGNFLRVPLRGLTVDEVHRMYEAIRGGTVTWARAEAVHRQTEGNPLFVQEVIRYTVEEGYVVREAGRWVIPEGTGPETGIPEGLRDVVGRRLNRLSEKSNQVLSVAAVIGREFRLDVLQKVAGLEEEELFAALEEAQERAIIEQRQMLGTVGFRFTHAFFRQTLYEELFAPRRIRWHQQVGRALEEVYVRRLEEHAAELAEHFSQSTEVPDLEKAVRYSELAAQRAASVYAYSEAVRLLEQALKAQEVLDPDNKSNRCDLLLALGNAQLPLGDPRKVIETIAPQAFGLAEALLDNLRASKACQLAIEAVGRSRTSENNEEARPWAERVDKVAPAGSTYRAYADIAFAPFVGDWEEFMARSRRGLDLARELGDPDLQFFAAWRNLAPAKFTPANLPALTEIASEFWRRPRTGVSNRNLSRYLLFSGSVWLAVGDRPRWEAAAQELKDLGTRTQDANVLVSAASNEVNRLILDGHLEEALAYADEAIASGRERSVATQPLLVGLLAAVYIGRTKEAPIGERLEPQVRQYWLDMILAGDGDVSSEQLTNARGVLEADKLSLGQRSDEPARTINVLLRMLVTATRLKDSSVVRQILDWPGLEGVRFNWYTFPFSVARLFSSGFRLIGDLERAKLYGEKAVADCMELGHRPESAISRLSLAEFLLEHYPDERAQAIEHLDFAIAEFREMKMQPSLERALRHRGLLKA